MGTSDAARFDEWYTGLGLASAHDDLHQRHLGLPPELLSTSLLTWDGIAEVVESLGLPADGTLVDLACGRGGYGMEVSRRTGAHLIGIDFSKEAVRLAREHADQRRWPAEFRVGDMTATGLPDASVDAVMVVDAVQFAEPQSAAYVEIHRILRPGGRVVLTCWEIDATREGHPSCSPEGRPGRRAWTGGVHLDRGTREAVLVRAGADHVDGSRRSPGDDPSLQGLHEEGLWVLSLPPGTRRVMGAATR
jgi:SAM-dependent methyltransferase